MARMPYKILPDAKKEIAIIPIITMPTASAIALSSKQTKAKAANIHSNIFK